MMKERAERMTEVYNLNAGAEIPLHLLSSTTKEPLAGYLHGTPEQNRREFYPLRQFRVFTRHRRTSAQVCYASMTSRFVTIFTSTFLNMIMIPALYLKYGRAEVPSPTRDYRHGRELASSGDLR
jgi:hypothetical protein